MPDDNQQPPDQPKPPLPDDFEDLPASAIFVEMMRQAAVRRTQALMDSTPDEEPEPAEPETTSAVSESNPSTVTPPEAPTATVAEAIKPPTSVTPPTNAGEGGTVTSTSATQPPEAVVPAPMPAKPAVTEATPSTSETPAKTTSGTKQEAHDAKMQEQRIRRVKRRKQQRVQRNMGILGGFFNTILITVLAAGLASTIFTWFTSPEFFKADVVRGLQSAQDFVGRIEPTEVEPTKMPTPNWARKIGIVSGHRGPINDPGAVCPDGLTEAEINFSVAQLVVRNLRAVGYSVDLLDEFDARLEGYQAAALVSIHSNTCQDYGEPVSGYLVARAAARPEGGVDDQLADCIAQYYGRDTRLERRFSLTTDMTDYHTFREIHALTPAAIIELGFMKDDREILTQQQDLLAESITRGIRCYLEPQLEPLNGLPEVTPEATAETTSS